MRRRYLLGLAVLAAAASVAGAQGNPPARAHRLGWLVGPTKEGSTVMRRLLVDTLARSGLVEGTNVTIIERYAGGAVERFPALAAEIARASPDVVIAHGTAAVMAVRAARPEVPVVFAFVGDPVGSGLVKDLAHPGDRVTGFSNQNLELVGKRLSVLREAFPRVGKVAVLHDPETKAEVPTVAAMRKAAATMGIELVVHDVTRPADYAPLFAALERQPPDAMFVFENISNVAHRGRIIEFARRRRIPALYGYDTFVDAGGLMSYAAPNAFQVTGAAEYAARILRGARPADLPVRLPDRYELVVNVGEARRSGLELQREFLLRADRVVE